MALGPARTVGRTAELDRLSGLLDELADGVGIAVAIEGEPGIGKTRLLADLRALADGRGDLVLERSRRRIRARPPPRPCGRTRSTPTSLRGTRGAWRSGTSSCSTLSRASSRRSPRGRRRVEPDAADDRYRVAPGRPLPARADRRRQAGRPSARRSALGRSRLDRSDRRPGSPPPGRPRPADPFVSSGDGARGALASALAAPVAHPDRPRAARSRRLRRADRRAAGLQASRADLRRGRRKSVLFPAARPVSRRPVRSASGDQVAKGAGVPRACGRGAARGAGRARCRTLGCCSRRRRSPATRSSPSSHTGRRARSGRRGRRARRATGRQAPAPDRSAAAVRVSPSLGQAGRVRVGEGRLAPVRARTGGRRRCRRAAQRRSSALTMSSTRRFRATRRRSSTLTEAAEASQARSPQASARWYRRGAAAGAGGGRERRLDLVDQARGRSALHRRPRSAPARACLRRSR